MTATSRAGRTRPCARVLAVLSTSCLHARARTAVAAALALLLLALAACSSSDDGDDGAAAAGADPDAALEEVTVEEVEGNTLLGRLEVTTSGAALPEITVTGPERSFEVPVDEPTTDTVVPLVGLRAETTYEVEVQVGDGEPQTTSFTTGALPEGLPPLSAAVSEPDEMAPGFTVFNLLDNAPPDPATVAEGDEPQLGWLVAVDAEGEVVWYTRADEPIGDARQLDDGTFLVEHADLGADVIDLFGEPQQTWAGTVGREGLPEDEYGRARFSDDATPVDTDSMHHEVGMLPNGNLLVLSTELRTYEGWDQPQCGEDPADFDGSYDLIADVVVEVAPDGEVVGEWPLADHFDPLDGPAPDQNICGIPVPGVFPTWVYQDLGTADARDWTHANGVILDEEHNALIVSVRHTDAVIAIRYQDDDEGEAGDLLWRMGPEGGLELAGDGDWTYHQHAPELQDDGTLLLYDNGNARPGTDLTTPPGPEPGYSRAVLYDISDLWEGGDTVTQLWEHRGEVDGQPAYASFVGDADRLENGDVLITHGGLAAANDGPSAQIVEVAPADDGDGGTVVFDLRVDGGPDWFVYRAERVPSLYG